MGNVDFALNAWISGLWTWRTDWVWSLLLIFLTVVIHISGLGLLNRAAVQVFRRIKSRRHFSTDFVVFMGALTLLATTLHVVSIFMWAAAYRYVDALPDFRSAILYSLNAMTSYGHESLFLESSWQMFGAAESLNGWLLFGLTTAFLFSLFQKAFQLEERHE
jgi:hypothetical protein